MKYFIAFAIIIKAIIEHSIFHNQTMTGYHLSDFFFTQWLRVAF